jgi:hypothetical protein
LCTTLMCEKPTTPTMNMPSDIANSAWMMTAARPGRAIGAGITESQWDGCMLFSCLAGDPGKVGNRWQNTRESLPLSPVPVHTMRDPLSITPGFHMYERMGSAAAWESSGYPLRAGVD